MSMAPVNRLSWLGIEFCFAVILKVFAPISTVVRRVLVARAKDLQRALEFLTLAVRFGVLILTLIRPKL